MAVPSSVSRSFGFHSKGLIQRMSQELPWLGAGAVAAARPLRQELLSSHPDASQLGTAVFVLQGSTAPDGFPTLLPLTFCSSATGPSPVFRYL